MVWYASEGGVGKLTVPASWVPLEDRSLPKYFIRSAEGTRGPLPGKEVQAMIVAGRLQPDDLLRLEGDRTWHPVRAVRGLRDGSAVVQSAPETA